MRSWPRPGSRSRRPPTTPAAGPVTAAELDEAYLVNALRSFWQANWGVYGARKLWHAARRAGHDIGRDQVARLMRIAGITGAVRGRAPHRDHPRDETAPRHPDLVKRGWHAPDRDRPAVGGRLLLRVDVGRVRATSRSSSTCSPAGSWAGGSPPPSTPAWSPTRCGKPCRSAAAASTNGPPAGLIHHSDAGSQYVSVAFTAELLDAGIAGSIGTVGDALDNACANRPSGCSRPKRST